MSVTGVSVVPAVGCCRGPRLTQVYGLAVEPVIGLETHVQLATRTKLFCGCPVEFGAPPNSRVCPVCLGLPGALPVVNRYAVELAVRAGLALNCRIADVAQWVRKNYFYPDLPKGYQISQFDRPLAAEGQFEFPLAGTPRRVRIRRAHLEEDAGKNLHGLPGSSAIDLNRAGTPLLEIVSEPDLHGADEVREFAIQLQRLVRYLGVSAADMQRGQMRFEPNVNVRIFRDGYEFCTPIVEVKNLNSFSALEATVAHEVRRQVEQWLADGAVAAPGNKANRGWDGGRGVTIPQREKEEPDDYRYFPDPDLPPLKLDRPWVRRFKEDMPELPICRTERVISAFKRPAQDAAALVEDRATADLLDDAADAGGDRHTLARQFLGFWARFANDRRTTIAGLRVSPGRLAELANLVATRKVNATAAARVAGEMLAGHEAPSAIAVRLGVLQSCDMERLARWVDQALADHPQAVHDATACPNKLKAARGFLLGQIMKLSGGQAEPAAAGDMVERRLADIMARQGQA